MILEDYYRIYEAKANKISNWNTTNINDLINNYIKYEKVDSIKAESYLAAVICSYWNILYKFREMSYGSVKDPEVYYSWMIGGILRGLKHRRWLDPSCSVYKDPTGPDKVLNRCMRSERKVWYQAMNTQKRKGEVCHVSLDELQEQQGDSFLEEEELAKGKLKPSYRESKIDLKNFIQAQCKENNYLLCFIIDAILNYGVFDIVEEDDKSYSIFNRKKLYKHMMHLNNNIIDEFSKDFEIPYDEVLKAEQDIRTLSRVKLYNRIDKCLIKLKEICHNI